MLTLNDSQWAELTARDTTSFVAAVCDQYLSARPDIAVTPGREAILMQMNGAHDYAGRIGFTATPHIVRWLDEAATRQECDPG